MQIKISRNKIADTVRELLSTEEGILLILSGSLAISDFDDLEVALEEAIKTLNGNKSYFQKITKKYTAKNN